VTNSGSGPSETHFQIIYFMVPQSKTRVDREIEHERAGAMGSNRDTEVKEKEGKLLDGWTWMDRFFA